MSSCSICDHTDDVDQKRISDKYVGVIMKMYNIVVSSSDSICKKCWNALIDLNYQSNRVNSVRLNDIPACADKCALCCCAFGNRSHKIPMSFVDVIKQIYNKDVAATTDAICESCWNCLINVCARRLTMATSNRPEPDDDEDQKMLVRPAKSRRVQSPFDTTIVTPPFDLPPPTPRGPIDNTSDSGSSLYPPTNPHTPSPLSSSM